VAGCARDPCAAQRCGYSDGEQAGSDRLPLSSVRPFRPKLRVWTSGTALLSYADDLLCGKMTFLQFGSPSALADQSRWRNIWIHRNCSGVNSSGGSFSSLMLWRSHSAK
jgi:hypothetical protein